MVSGNKNNPESTTHPPAEKYPDKNPVTVVLEKYLVKYFHELLTKDVKQACIFNLFNMLALIGKRFR